MIALYGRDKVEEFKKLADVTVKYTISDYLEIEATFKQKIIDLGVTPA